MISGGSSVVIYMKKFSTVVPNEVGEVFLQWCADHKSNPYDTLSTLVHKVAGIARKAPAPRVVSTDMRAVGIEAKLVELSGPPGASRNNRKRCCSEDCFSIENDRLKCSTTGTPSPYHVE